jgi:hypothetical protein
MDKRLLEHPCASIGVAAAVGFIWTVAYVFIQYNRGFITFQAYLHTGWGACDDEQYIHSVNFRVDRQEECLQHQAAYDATARERYRALAPPANHTMEAWMQYAMAKDDWIVTHLVDRPVCQIPPQSDETPIVVSFLGVSICTMEMYISLQTVTFVGTMISAYTINTAGLYISNVIRDSGTLDIPYDDWIIHLSVAALTIHWSVASVFEWQASFTQWDFLAVVILGQIIFNTYLNHKFLREKHEKKEAILRLRKLKAQQTRSAGSPPEETEWDPDTDVDPSSSLMYYPAPARGHRRQRRAAALASAASRR